MRGISLVDEGCKDVTDFGEFPYSIFSIDTIGAFLSPAWAQGCRTPGSAPASAAMKIAYLVGHYPAISHTFILREVEGLRARGVEIETISVHRAAESQLLTDAGGREHASTYTILPPRWGELARAHLSAFARAPFAYLSTLALVAPPQPARAPGTPLAALLLRRGDGRLEAVQGAGNPPPARPVHQPGDRHRAARHPLRVRSSPPWTWSFTVHGPDEFYEVSRFNLRAKVESADFVVCISDFARSQLMAQVPEEHWGKLRVIHCGIDPEVFSPPAERNGAGGLDVLSVGRLVPFKGQGLLIEALAALAARGIDARATVVGWGENRPGLESLAAELGVADRVTFTGALGQDEIRALLEAADVFCLPSFAEGVPVVADGGDGDGAAGGQLADHGHPGAGRGRGQRQADRARQRRGADRGPRAAWPADPGRAPAPRQGGTKAGDRALRDRRVDGAAPRALQRSRSLPRGVRHSGRAPPARRQASARPARGGCRRAASPPAPSGCGAGGCSSGGAAGT